MKDEDLKFGRHKVGIFFFILSPPTFDWRHEGEIPFFEVLVEEMIHPNQKDSWCYWVNLVEDSRFNLFSSFSKFERSISNEELIERNSFVQKKKITMHTWKLSRATVREMMDLASKAKKRSVPDPITNSEIQKA